MAAVERVRDAIMGKIKIPTDKAVLLKDVADRVAHEDAGIAARNRGAAPVRPIRSLD